MTTLVTGVTGFACSNFARALTEAGEEVVGLDVVPPSREWHRFMTGVREKIAFVVGDVLDAEAVRSVVEERGVRKILHGAGIVPASEEQERSVAQSVTRVNLLGTARMLAVARRVSLERFLFVSSAGVYGTPKDRTVRISEDAPLQLTNLYTISKYTGELLVKRYGELFGFSTVAGRMAGIYGPMERRKSSWGNLSVIYRLVEAVIAEQPVTVRGCDFMRDYTHVGDASAIWRELTLANDLDHAVYNVSGGMAYSLAQVLGALDDAGATLRYRHAASHEDADVEIASEDERAALDITRVATEFQFSPKYDLRRGLDTYLEWARQHPSFFVRG
jgi:UDP-glucuronate 4-epimerase